jgi:glucose-1-phosphate thymidylyltransferase
VLTGLVVMVAEGWYDAGKPETLLDTNRVMLEKGRARIPVTVRPDQVVEPVYIEDGVTIIDSRVGPNVSIGTGTEIIDSEIRDSIVGEGARISRSSLTNSLIGDAAAVEGIVGEVSVGDHSEVRGKGVH